MTRSKDYDTLSVSSPCERVFSTPIANQSKAQRKAYRKSWGPVSEAASKRDRQLTSAKNNDTHHKMSTRNSKAGVQLRPALISRIHCSVWTDWFAAVLLG
jgi:hypothetical protein